MFAYTRDGSNCNWVGFIGNGGFYRHSSPVAALGGQNGLMAKKGRCDWCGTEVLEGDGYRLIQPKRNLGATFCRLEHVVPWLMKKNDWHIWDDVEVPEGV